MTERFLWLGDTTGWKPELKPSKKRTHPSALGRLTLHKLLEDFLREWDVIKGAPRSFAISCLIITGAVWFVISQLYASENSTLKATIGLYQAKLNVATPDQAKDKIDLLKEEIEKLKNPPRDPDGLYQLGSEVGSVGSSNVDVANGIVEFLGVRSEGRLNPNEDVEFRDYKLRCSGLPSAPHHGVFAGSVIGVSAGANCKIISKR